MASGESKPHHVSPDASAAKSFDITIVFTFFWGGSGKIILLPYVQDDSLYFIVYEPSPYLVSDAHLPGFRTICQPHQPCVYRQPVFDFGPECGR